MTNVYLRDPSNFAALNDVDSSYFTDGNRLVRTCLQNHIITDIEIDVIAYCHCDRVSSDAVR
jgi:enamine deaminase RidA (YjgF/YER057c/UK114 family)